MSNQKSIIAMIKAISGQSNVLTIPRIYITLTGSHRAALFLSQCVYWSDKTRDPDGWFYKTDSEWREELGLPRGGVETATKAVSKWVSTDLRYVKGAPRTHYRVNLDLLVSDISYLLESDKTDLLENSNTTIAEITSEIEVAVPPDVRSAYESGIGLLTPIALDALESMCAEYTPAWVVEALGLMVQKNAKSLNYAEAILKRWKADGKMTPASKNGRGKTPGSGLMAKALADLEETPHGDE